MQREMDRQKTMVLVLSALLVLALAYIGFDKYQRNKQQEQFNVYQQGVQDGFRQAIIQIIQQASTCQQIPLIVENTTINMIAVDCLSTSEGD